MLKCLSLTLAALLLAPALEAAEGTRPPDRPTLMLFDRQDTNGKFVIPLLFLKEVSRDGSPEGKEVVFQFAETRRVDDPETSLESAWYRLYDYDPRMGLGPERGGCATFDRLARGARCTEALLPAIEWVSGSPRLLESRRIPYPKPQENYFIYRDNDAFHVELRLGDRRAAFRFAEYAPIRDLFQASGIGRSFLLEGEPDTAIPIFSVPGDVRPRDAQGRELPAVCYPSRRTSLQAVVTFGDPAAALPESTREEDRRLFFDLGRRPGDLSGPNPVPENQPPSWLLSLPLRHAFFATSDTVAEIVLPPGAFRRLASIALAPDGRPYERQERPEKLFVRLGAEFDLNARNTRRRVLQAANLEQRAILERLGSLGTGTADADLHLGPSDWPLDSAFRPHEKTRSFQDLTAGDRIVRLRDRVLHRPSGGSFRLIPGPQEGSWFYIQETEVSIRQWQRFLESSAGAAYLRTLGEPNLPLRDPLEKFLRLIASRMERQDNLPSPNPETEQTPRKWETEISADMPMVFLSPESAEQYNAWLGAGSVEVRLPKLEEWRQAARLNDLRAAIEAGAQVGDLVWVGGKSKPNIPHILSENVRGAWRSHETLISMVGNVAELVKDGTGFLAVGAHFGTQPNTETVLPWSRAQEPQEASVFVGLRPVLVPKTETQ